MGTSSAYKKIGGCPEIFLSVLLSEGRKCLGVQSPDGRSMERLGLSEGNHINVSRKGKRNEFRHDSSESLQLAFILEYGTVPASPA